MKPPLTPLVLTLLLAACGTMPTLPPEPSPTPEPEPATYTVTNLVAVPPTVAAGDYIALEWDGNDPKGYLITNTIGLVRAVGPFTSTFVYPRATTTYRVAPHSNPRTGYAEVTVTVVGSPPDALIMPPPTLTKNHSIRSSTATATVTATDGTPPQNQSRFTD